MSTSQNENNDLEKSIDKELEKRPRSATLLSLKWLAERVRKKSEVVEKVREGNYELDSKKIAEAILNK